MLDAPDRTGEGETSSPAAKAKRRSRRRWWPSIPITVAGVVAIIVTAVAGGSGCGSGNRTIRDRADGFSVAVPACWQTKPASALSQGAEKLAGTPLAGDLSAFNSVKDRFKLIVVDPNTTPHQNAGVGMVPGPLSTVNSDPGLRDTLRQDLILGQANSGFVIQPGPLQRMNGMWYFAEREHYPGRVKGLVVRPSVMYNFLAPNALYFLYVYGTSTSEANTIARSFKIFAPS